MFLSSYPFIHPINPFTMPVAHYMSPDVKDAAGDQSSDPQNGGAE